MRKRKTRKQKIKSELRNEYQKTIMRGELQRKEDDAYNKRKICSIKLNLLVYVILMFVLFIFVVASVFFCLDETMEYNIPKCKLIEYINNADNIGYYLSFVSIVYTFALEIQELFFQCLGKKGKKSFGNKYLEKIKDVGLIFFPLIILIVLLIAHTFKRIELTNVISSVTLLIYTLYLTCKQVNKLSSEMRD